MDSHVSVVRDVWSRKTEDVTQHYAVDILARFLPRSGESRDDGLSVVEASGLRGPAILRCIDSGSRHARNYTAPNKMLLVQVTDRMWG